MLQKEFVNDETFQFMTIAGDGHVFFFDTRFELINSGQLLHIAKVRSSKTPQQKPIIKKNGKSMIVGKSSWTPFYSIKTKRLDGLGELSPSKFLNSSSVASKNRSTKVSRYVNIILDPCEPVHKHEKVFQLNLPEFSLHQQIVCSSEEGELMEINWRSPDPSDSDAHHHEMDFVQWISSDQSRASLALERSSFFPSIVMSVSDWNFNLWDVIHKRMFFSSPKSHIRLTGGSWSPTRAGTLFLSKSDGSIDVWDFTDSSYKPSVTLITTPSRITSMQFLKTNLSSENEQLLAIGDGDGSLHIFEMPSSLLAPNLNEENIMFDFIEREMRTIVFGDSTR